MRRFGSRVTVIEHGQQLAGREDADFGAAILELFQDEGITVHLQTRILSVAGESGRDVRIVMKRPDGEVLSKGPTCSSAWAVRRTPAVSGWSGPG